MSYKFEAWLGEVNLELNSIKMRMEDWQDLVPFDFGVDLGCSTIRQV
jgi:hypothetical protein